MLIICIAMKKDIIELERLLKSWLDYSRNGGEKPEDRWLMMPELSELLRCSETTLYRKLKNGELKYSKPSGIMVWLSEVAIYVHNKQCNV